MVEINPPLIGQPKFKDMQWLKNIQLLHNWQRNAFDRCKLGNQMHSIANCVVIEVFLVITWLVIEKFGRCKLGNQNFLDIGLVTKKFLSL
jgi:hypothetical protein